MRRWRRRFRASSGLCSAKSDAELGRWRDALREALGPNGRLMVDLVPELKLIIGEQPPVPELPPQDAQRRFQLVFRRFIGVFARPEHPLALFLDDLQWLDAATLDLLEDLLTQPDVQHLLLIGAYRDNEVTAAHPLMRTLDAIRARRRARCRRSRLAPLARDDVGQLVADALRCTSARAAPLAQLVHEKTAGNPFFVIQFLYALAEEGLLTFDHDDGALVAGTSTASTPRGTPTTSWTSWWASCSRLPVDDADRRCSSSPASATAPRSTTLCDRARDLGGAGPRGALGGGPPGVGRAPGGRLPFLHDRVQEAAYALIPEASAPRRICGSAGCSRRTRRPRSGRRRSSRSSISSTAAPP